MVVGVILGPIAEIQLRRALQISVGDWTHLVSTPIAAIFLTISAVALVAPFALRGLSRFRAGED